MMKKTWKTITALTLTAGLMFQPVSAAYAAEGDWLVEDVGEVITENTWTEDYGAADEAGYAADMEYEMEEELVEGGDTSYSEEQSAADSFADDEGYVTEDGSLPAELWVDVPQNTESTGDTVLFDEDTVTEDIVSEDTAGKDESANADTYRAGSDEGLLPEELLSGTDELIGDSGQLNLLAAADVSAADDSVVVEEELSMEETAGIDGAVDNSEDLFEKLAEIEFYGDVLEEQNGSVEKQNRSAGEEATFASADADFAAVNYLSGINLELYNANVPELKKISSGSRESAVIEITDESLGKEEMTATAEELGVSILTVVDGKTVISEAAKNALTAKYNDRYAYSAQTLLNAFLADLPYDLYWFNKASGQGGMKLQRMGSYKATKERITLTNARYVFSYTVSNEYAKDGEAYVVDQTDRHVLDTAVANAKAIVAKYASSGDRDKLDAYRLEICDLVTYQMPLDTAYGNAWQLIWVFDGDPATNVVCEGYAKAFAYLAQLSTFISSKVEVKLVSGYISPDKTAESRHMWNVVRMDDGSNYLVDVTGCDSAGDDRFFLKGATGSIAEGYTCNGRPYYYQASSVSAYGGGEELELSPCNYGEHKLVAIEELKPTCTQDGHTAGTKCEVCGKLVGGEVIPATGHTIVVKPGREVTCTEDGLTDEWDCSVCGEVLLKPEVIKAKGHKKDGGTVTKNPTVFEDGVRTYKCPVCKEVVEEEPIDKLAPTLTLSVSGTISMWNGKTQTVNASGLARGDSVKSAVSSDTAIVRVSLKKNSSGGVITLNSKAKGGTAKITVTLASGYQKSFKVKVSVKTAKIKGVPGSKTLKKGNTYQLAPVLVPATSTQKITYTSNNKAVATVSSKGLIKAKKAGTAKITVVSGSQKKVVKVTVK